jgi:hypothetical protein
MALSDPYAPGAINAPHPAVGEIIDQRQIQIGGDTGTIGTYAIIGRDLTYDGVPIPSGTRQVILNLQVPASASRVQDLEVTAAGIAEDQLTSIVSAGLNQNISTTTTTETTAAP